MFLNIYYYYYQHHHYHNINNYYYYYLLLLLLPTTTTTTTTAAAAIASAAVECPCEVYSVYFYTLISNLIPVTNILRPQTVLLVQIYFFCERLLSGTLLFYQCPYGVSITMVTCHFMRYGIFYQKALYKICPEFRWPAFLSTFFPCMISLLKCHVPPSYSFPLHQIIQQQ